MVESSGKPEGYIYAREMTSFKKKPKHGHTNRHLSFGIGHSDLSTLHPLIIEVTISRTENMTICHLK